MTDNPPSHAPEAPGAPTSDATNALEVQGPTVRQELFLRRQGLWDGRLSPQQASIVIQTFITKKQHERFLAKQQTGSPPES